MTPLTSDTWYLNRCIKILFIAPNICNWEAPDLVVSAREDNNTYSTYVRAAVDQSGGIRSDQSPDQKIPYQIYVFMKHTPG